MGIRMGIIGYGGMAHWHKENSVRIDDVKVIGAYDIDPKQVEKANNDGIIGYSKLEDMLGNPEINLCLVATPNNVHKEMVIRALNAGKHVICEKPVTLSVKDLDEMIAAAQENNRVFTVHQNRRWDHDYKVAKKVFEDGTLGKVYSIQSRLHGSGGIMHGWRGLPEYGGGMVFDWGVHFFDQILNMVPGKCLSVFADTHNVKTPEVDDYFCAMLKFENEICVTVEVGTFVLKENPRWLICGNAGSMVINDFNGANGEIIKVSKLAEFVPPVIVQTSSGPTRTFAPQPPETKEHVKLPEVKAEWVEYYANVRDVIDGKAKLIVQPKQIRRNLSLIEKVFESARTGKSVDFEC